MGGIAKPGVHAFLRAYFIYKSADWRQNQPFPLKCGAPANWPGCRPTTSWILAATWRQPSLKKCRRPAEIVACRWLPDGELAVYSAEYQRNGFQGGLNWYRARTAGRYESELQLFSGRTIDVPSLLVYGNSDWGVYQMPGSFERMHNRLYANAGLPPDPTAPATGCSRNSPESSANC